MYHQSGIGVKCIFVDQSKKGFLYSPNFDKPINIPFWKETTVGAIFESQAHTKFNVFLVWDTESVVHTAIYTAETMKGPQCISVSTQTTILPFGYLPILFLNDSLICQAF